MLWSYGRLSFHGAPNLSYSVTDENDQPKTLYASSSGTPLLSSAIATDADGNGFAYTQGLCKLWLNGSLVRDNLNIPWEYTGTSGILSPVTNYSEASPDDFPGANFTERFNAAALAMRDVGGTVVLSGGRLTVNTDPATGFGLILWNNVCLRGVSSTATILSLADGSVGSVLLSWPWEGAGNSVGGKHVLDKFQIDGNQVGASNLNADATANSAVLTNVSSFTGVANGYMISGEGLTGVVTIQSFDSGAGTITCSAAITNNVVYTATGRRWDIHPAWTVTATSTVGSPVLNVTAGDLTPFKAGMRLQGTNLDQGEPDLKSTSRIRSVDQGALTITMDTNARVSGSFTVTGYIWNDGLFIAPRTYNPTYDPSKEYRAPYIGGVMIQACSGSGVNCRTNRDQLVIGNEFKSISNYGWGVEITGSNDSKFSGPTGIGVNRLGNLLTYNCSTFRDINSDNFDSRQPTQYPSYYSNNNRQQLKADCDINGPVWVRGEGASDAKFSNIRHRNVNHKWHSGDGYPDGTYPQSVRVRNGAQVFETDGYFDPDHDDWRCPDYLADVSDTGSLYHTFGSAIITDPLDVSRPYKVAPFNTSSGGKVRGEYYDITNDCFIRMGDAAEEASLKYQDTATDRRATSNGSQRNMSDRLALQILETSGTIASFNMWLPYIHYGSKYMDVQFTGGVITLLNWFTYRADDTTLDQVPSADDRFDDSTAKDLPFTINGNTTVRLFWDGTAAVKKWTVVALARAADPYVAVSYAATINLDLDLGTKFIIGDPTTGITGDMQLNNPTHMYDGAVFEVMFKSDGSARNVTVGGKWRTPGGFATPAITTTANALYKLIGGYSKTFDIVDTEVRSDIKA